MRKTLIKKGLTLALACIGANGAFAQISKLQYGLKAGVNYSQFNYSGNEVDDAAKDGSKGLLSFHFTGLVDIPVLPALSVQPGLSLTGKGIKFELSYSSQSNLSETAGNINIMYLELPINVVYKVKGLYFGAGPYAAYGIAGKIKFETTDKDLASGVITTTKSNEDISFGSDKDEDDFKSADFGLNVLAGYQLKNGLNIGANYGLGLSNINTLGSSEYKQSNRVVSVSVGFMF
ncbi:MAG: porin family protein [Daejeonella sp.]